MRTRHSTGGVRKQRGRWIGLWYEDGIKKSRVLGFVKDMTKGDARAAVGKIVAELRVKQANDGPLNFGVFVEKSFFAFYTRKWKESTRENTVNRINVHLVAEFKHRDLPTFQRDELQDFLDAKAGAGLSFSVVDHLRWDLKSIFDMAIAEGHIRLNPALLLFTPREAKKPIRRAMTIAQVRICFDALEPRERLIAKLAILAGMRPGEIFGLTWGRLKATHAEVFQRVYRRKVNTPKTDNSLREAALSAGLLVDIEAWRAVAVSTADEAWVFPSERLTPLSKDNCWYRIMRPALNKVGLGWANFQVMRRTHSSLMKEMKADPKLVADQMGHTLDVNQNVYTHSPVASRLVIVNQLERQLLVE